MLKSCIGKIKRNIAMNHRHNMHRKVGQRHQYIWWAYTTSKILSFYN